MASIEEQIDYANYLGPYLQSKGFRLMVFSNDRIRLLHQDTKVCEYDSISLTGYELRNDCAHYLIEIAEQERFSRVVENDWAKLDYEDQWPESRMEEQ